MTPQEMEKRILDLEKQMKELHASSSIPLEVDVAFKRRLGIADLSIIVVSSKGITTENQAVNEAGAASYSVLKAPDLFLQLRVSGTTYYIPVFT